MFWLGLVGFHPLVSSVGFHPSFEHVLGIHSRECVYKIVLSFVSMYIPLYMPLLVVGAVLVD